MILVFGGTTEGRKTVKELEEAGNVFYYSTKTGEQEIAMRHGVRVDGGMDEESMKAFCLEHHIQLLIDAAHPFAELLHATVAKVSQKLSLPVIRFERIYPQRTDDVTWCDNMDGLISAVRQFAGSRSFRILNTLGVKSISKIKLLEKEGHHVFYRILPRESSKCLALSQGALEQQLVYYQEGQDETSILDRLRPDIILMKESGTTGGFITKVEAAKKLGIKMFAIQRPSIPEQFYVVNGEHGLRRMVERLLPDFYPLHSGLTTGTCATAAAIAAWRKMYGENPNEVAVILPNGESIHVPVAYGDDFAVVVKDAGDDPDVTDGLEIRARVCRANSFQIKGGDGVGVFTLPGFDYPVGEYAINKGPREMMRRNIKENVCITISVPQGKEIARRTFNPRLGIEGGISIIGVSGIVKPFSEEAFIESIHKCMEVAKASGSKRVVINSGAKSERFVKGAYPDLPTQAFVEYGNYIGETLKIADELAIEHVTLGLMLGKAVKLAAGHLDTHSRKTTMDKSFIKQMAAETHCDASIIKRVEQITLAREIWQLLPEPYLNLFCQIVIKQCLLHCQPLLPHGHLTILLISEEGHIYALS